MECECAKSRNSKYSFAILLFGMSTVIWYLLLFSVRLKIFPANEDELIWILIASIILGSITTGLVLIVQYLIYKD